MRNEENIWSIIKKVLIKCLDTETSTEAGRMNLAFGVIISIPVIAIAVGNSILDKILLFLNKNYNPGIPWYGVLALIVLLGVFFWVCIRSVSKINSIINRDGRLRCIQEDSQMENEEFNTNAT
ncbi:hypothetical protein [Clostridium perfringens]|uniref:hypothetical protein n=1 Tax=Clostridium perfringens TaxID=1502 RepID=UPI00290066BB|nr:hypothetical protein [Clostridium perfringens]MDU2516868.1 hypothetical protein [Clostridium perfringens]